MPVLLEEAQGALDKGCDRGCSLVGQERDVVHASVSSTIVWERSG
jgi:hypothetical protein